MLQNYKYCEVVFYNGWNDKVYLYLIDNKQLKVGDFVVVPPNNNVAEIKQIKECSYFDKPKELITDMTIKDLATNEQIDKKDEQQRIINEINKSPIEKGVKYCRVVYEETPYAKRYCYEVSEELLFLKEGDYVCSPNGKKVKVVELFCSEEVPKDLRNSYKIIKRFR